MTPKQWVILFFLIAWASGGWVVAQWVPTVFLNGRAIHEDGRPVSHNIPVELVCDGKIVEQTYPDLKGEFVFELSTLYAQPEFMDSSVGDTIGVPSQGSTDSKFGSGGGLCEIRIPPQPGYVSNSIPLSHRGAFDDTDVGLIVLRQPDYEGGTVVSVMSQTAPDEAREALERAKEELAKKEVEHSSAARELESAVKLYPQYAEAWHLLGQTLRSLGDRDGAREALRQAILADERFLLPYMDLANLEFQDKNWEAVCALSDKLSELNPELPEVYYYGGLAKYSSGRLDEAEESLRWLEKKELLERYPLAYFYLGMIDSKRGRIKRAAEELRLFLKFAPEAQVPPAWRKQINDQLASWQEQGLIGEE